MGATRAGFRSASRLRLSGQYEVGDLLCVGRGSADLPGILLEGRDPNLDLGGAPARVVAYGHPLPWRCQSLSKY